MQNGLYILILKIVMNCLNFHNKEDFLSCENTDLDCVSTQMQKNPMMSSKRIHIFSFVFLFSVCSQRQCCQNSELVKKKFTKEVTGYSFKTYCHSVFLGIVLDTSQVFQLVFGLLGSEIFLRWK